MPVAWNCEELVIVALYFLNESFSSDLRFREQVSFLFLCIEELFDDFLFISSETVKSTTFIESPEEPLLFGMLKSGEQDGPCSPLVDTCELEPSDFSNLDMLLLLSRTDTNC